MSNKWLKQALFLSGGLNIVLVALFFYLVCRDSQARLFFAYKPTKVEKVIPPALLEGKSYEELIALLSNSQFRQAALSTLVSKFDFDLERASISHSIRRMNDEDFDKVIQFAKEEVYPFTAKGLYNRLPQSAELFCYTPGFVQLEMIFTRLNLPITRQTLISLVSEGSYETLSNYLLEQKLGANYGEERREQLLMDYIHDGSRTAAYLLLITDLEFAKNALTDDEIIDLLLLLNVKTGEASNFAKAILESHRSDVCKKKAFDRLSEYEGTMIAPRVAPQVAARFYPRPAEGELEPAWRERHPKALPNNMHVVELGESLWIIAKKHKVTIEAIIKANDLSSTTIQPGRLLKIP